ncbi:alpha/beta hydrolase family protein [Sphingomonas sp. HT-1]|uniref:alpha/beta hydrolase family protein n=1 Tax=unclassified Sphingomonas TaxID=196159 RepID=UPI0002D8773B|nr:MULTISPECIES: prolyl oligopeptidase family serine peptidase [unclassified Sphingomonas]
MRFLTSLFLALALCGCTVTVGQSSLLPAIQEKPRDAVAPLAGYSRQDRILTLPDLGNVHVVRLAKPGNRTTILYSGGNRYLIAYTGNRLNELAAMTGADIVTFDYPDRGGTTVPKTTDALIAFGPALVAALRQEGWIGNGPLYAHGFSFGGAMASNMARTGGFSGLILEATAADIGAVARNMVPTLLKPFLWVKVSKEIRRYDYAGYALAARAPILVLAGSEDKTVRPRIVRRFAERLRSAGAAVTFVEVPGDHGKALASPQGREALQGFMRRASE